MIERSFRETRSNLARKAVQAIEKNDHDILHGIGTLLPTLNQVQETVFTTLGDYGDVAKPEALSDETAEQPREFVGVVQHLHGGFLDAQQVLFHNMLTAAQQNDQQQVEHNVEHTLRVAHAWHAVEEAFAQPDIQQTLEAIVPPVKSPERRDVTPLSVWQRLGTMLLEPQQIVRQIPVEVPQPLPENMSFWSDLNKELQRFAKKRSHDVLRQMRLDENMTQSEVAKQAKKGKSISYVSAVERGQINPSTPAVLEIFAATHNNPKSSVLPFVWLIKAYEEQILGK